MLTSLRSVTDQTGDPSQIRAFIRKAVADGADFVKSSPRPASGKAARRR